MKKEKIKSLLNSIQIPEPDAAAREKARQAAMAEFHRTQEEEQEKIKGILKQKRLTGKKPKGGPVMRKPLYITAGLATGLIGLMIALTLPNFMAYRTRGSGKTSYETAPMTEIARAPAGRASHDQGPRPMVALEKRVAEGMAGDAGQTMQDAVPAAESAKKLYRANGKAMFAAPPADLRYDQFTSLRKGSPMKNEWVGLEDQTYVGRDRFETITVNPIKLVSEAPVSTFSIDVDTASYAFVRRALNSGVLPQKNAVRVEELINYFDYDYPLPDDRAMPFKSFVALLPTPWNPDTKLMHIGIKGIDIIPEKRPRTNLVFLIDVSGSMQSRDKLPLLKNAFRMLVDTLDAEDIVSMVVYAGAAGTVLEPTKVKEKGKIIAALDRLRAGGSTAGGEGIRQAYALAKANFDPEGVNRVILATDGDFNVGIRNPEELKGFVERKRKTGIFLSVLGFGQGNYNDALMQKLAQNGNGNAAYIDTLSEARKVLVDEAHSTLFTIAKDVKIQVEFNPARVAEYRLIGYETRMLRREDFNNDRVDAGDIGSGHS
ncbi:VWA domain-containing protein, partial [Thermodesulfobacteriota bacterium]